jgi:hypothetical protein
VRRRGLVPAILAGLLLFGCGAPDELSREDAERLGLAAERFDDAIDTHETLRTSPAEARRLRSKAQAIVSRGAFESSRLDEFGLAALGELQMIVPSLVFTDGEGTPTHLDRASTRVFLRFAVSDPGRALAGPIRREVDAIERVLDDSEADGATRVPRVARIAAGDRTVADLLRRLERDLRPAFPRLADSVRRAREDL